ncbi:MAG: hypothetical protein JWM68_5474, partial [Verrucomicrobiales bacterium]|nr:hypothetical protein [Verrucomicrobiales bacterium]
MAELKATNRPGVKPQERAATGPATSCGNEADPDACAPKARRVFCFSCLALFALTLFAFWPSIHNDFFFWYGDDPLYVTENSHVNTGLTWENIAWAFRSTDHSNWHPLTWMSHMIDCNLYGLQPAGHHLTNVLLHAMNGVLLFVLLRGLTHAAWRSFAVALFFAVHPLRVESVAWVAERKDVLSVFFLFLTLLMYSRYVREARMPNPKPYRFYALALIFYVCGLMSKATLVTVPCILVLLDYWPLQRSEQTPLWKRIVTKWPFFLFAIATSAITYFAQNHWGFVKALSSYSFSARLENAVVSYVRYLGHLVWPVHLASWYPLPHQWPWFIVAGSVLMVVLISLAVFLSRKRWPFLCIGWFWYLGTLVPMIGVVQVGEQALADRFTYIPVIGLLICVVWGSAELFKRWRHGLLVAAVTGLMVFVPCLVLTREYISEFKDSLTIWRHNMELTGKHGLAQYAYALSLDHQGHPQEAIRELEDIVEVKPDWAEARANLAGILDQQGRRFEALMHYRQAVKLQPDNAETHLHLATLLQETGELEDAISHYHLVLQADAAYAKQRRKIDLSASDTNSAVAALREFREAIRFRPDYCRAHNELGIALGRLGRFGEGISHFEEALIDNPNYV